MRIVIIGANGQLGSDLTEVLKKQPERYKVIGVDLPAFDICKHAEVRSQLTTLNPNIVINMAAFHRVDDCEDQVETSYAVNAIAVRNLALICRDLDIPLMHFSTDFVFGADKSRKSPYKETDTPGPLSVYAASKLAGEHLLRLSWHEHFIIRACGLYGRTQSPTKAGGNFVETMLKLGASGRSLKIINDQRLAPTSTYDLAPRLEALLNTDAYGLYHLTAGGDCTWYEFAQAIFKLAKMNVKITPVSTEEYAAKADRPRYSVLDNSKAHSIGIKPLMHWREALAEYLNY